MIKLLKKGIMTAVFATLFAGNAFTVTFHDLASDLHNSYEVRNAALQKENAYNAVRLSENPGDVTFSFVPTVKTVTNTGGTFPDKTEITGSVSARIPLSLSEEGKEKLEAAKDTVNITDRAVGTAERKAFVTLYNLYQTAWLLQEEENVLQAELTAAKDKADTLTSQYESGSLSLAAITSSQEELRTKQEEYSQAITKQHVSRYELFFVSHTPIGTSAERDVPLERYELPMDTLPLPPELTTAALAKNPDLLAQKIKIDQLKRTDTRLASSGLSVSIKPFLGTGEYTASLEYTGSAPALTVSGSFPMYTTGSPSVQGNSTWNAGVTVNLSYNTGATDNLNRNIVQTSLVQETEKLEYMKNYISLQIRSAYQQYRTALDSLEAAKRNLEISRENIKIVKTKSELGQTSHYEQEEAQALVTRALWRVESARIEIEKAYLYVAITASWGDIHE